MGDEGFLKGDMSRREAMKTALKAGAYAAPFVVAAAVPVGVAAATPAPPSACIRPFSRSLATIGTGTGGTVQSATNCGSGFLQSFQVTLAGAPANTAFDVYIDQNSIGIASSHIFAGTFSTDASGNATFSARITVPTAATQVDNEIVLHDPTHTNFDQHQYIQSSIPLAGACTVPCTAFTSAALPVGATSPQTGTGRAVDAPNP